MNIRDEIRGVMEEISISGRVIYEEAVESVSSLERWNENIANVALSFLDAFSEDIPEAQADRWHEEASLPVFVMSSRHEGEPRLTEHTAIEGDVVTFPLSEKAPRDRLGIEPFLNAAIETNGQQATASCMQMYLQDIAGDCSCESLTFKPHESWCVYLHNGLNHAVHEALENCQQGWADRMKEALAPATDIHHKQRIEMFSRISDSVDLTSNKTLRKSRYPMIMHDICSTIAFEDIFEQVRQSLANKGFDESLMRKCKDSARSMIRQKRPNMLRVPVEGEGYTVEAIVKKMLSTANISFKTFGSQYDKIMDSERVKILDAMGAMNLFSFTMLGRIDSAEQMLKDTPGALTAYTHCITNRAVMPTSTPTPGQVAGELRRELNLTKGAWKILAKSQVLGDSRYFNEQRDRTALSVLFNLANEVGSDPSEPILRAAHDKLRMYTGQQNDERRTRFLPVVREFFKQSKLPTAKRRQRMEDDDLAGVFVNVGDWAMTMIEQNAALPQKSQWGGLVNATDRWHRELLENKARDVAERKIRDEIERYGSVRTWESVLGEFVIDGYLITPMLSPVDLAAAGNENAVCVGSAGNYANSCAAGEYRIFTVRKGGKMSVLTIERRRSDTWKVAHHLGKRNSPVSAPAKEAAAEVARLYTTCDPQIN